MPTINVKKADLERLVNMPLEDEFIEEKFPMMGVEVEEIFEVVKAHFKEKDFKGKKVLVVANKIDVADEEVERYVSEKYSPIKVSCAENVGIEKVKRAIINELWRQ